MAWSALLPNVEKSLDDLFGKFQDSDQ